MHRGNLRWCCVCCLCVCLLEWVLRQNVHVHVGSTKLSLRPLTGQRNMCVSAPFTYKHTLKAKCLKLKAAVSVSVDESSHGIFSLGLLLQVLKYLDYVFTGVFTFEMVIKVRRLQVDFGLSSEIKTSFGNFQIKENLGIAVMFWPANPRVCDYSEGEHTADSSTGIADGFKGSSLQM